MHSESINVYEQVFECWLGENHIPFVRIDQTKRPEQGQGDIKNFDFLLRADSQHPILVELKGRTFHGASLAGLKGMDGWVTFEDVHALSHWQAAFAARSAAARALFVFIFRLEQIDVETDGRPVYDCGGRRFLMLAIPLEHYRDRMKPRSPKWQTVTLAAEDFRRYAVQVEKALK